MNSSPTASFEFWVPKSGVPKSARQSHTNHVLWWRFFKRPLKCHATHLWKAAIICKYWWMRIEIFDCTAKFNGKTRLSGTLLTDNLILSAGLASNALLSVGQSVENAAKFECLNFNSTIHNWLVRNLCSCLVLSMHQLPIRWARNARFRKLSDNLKVGRALW